MPLSAGDHLGPYEILSPLGKGGMGEVWRARDPRLNRDVAIKVSAERFTERFSREAQAVAALNHPNICTLHDVGPDYLVMELVDGVPLRAPDSTRKLLDMAVQIADGLAAAHTAGIIHRDLKPDNILITREGRVKILDFGLATNAASVIGPEDSTRAISLTEAGTTVGTAAYMSPEQARGDVNLTAQSDQFSFGLVLYELIAGKRAFQRGSRAETMAAIIREEAEPLPVSVPAPLRWIVTRLLSKEPADRYDSTRDLYRDLRQLRDGLSEAQPTAIATGAPKARIRIPLMLGIVAATLVIGGALTLALLPPPQDDVSKYKFTPISREEVDKEQPAWSPDGKSIAYIALIRGIGQVFTRNVGAHDPAQLTKSIETCSSPFWSADGSTIYYITPSGLWAVGASGGAPERMLDGARAAAVHPDGKTFAFVRDNKLWVGQLKGGKPIRFGQNPFPATTSAPWLKFSPDGRKLAVVDSDDDDLHLWALAYPSGRSRKFELPHSYTPDWLPDSRRLVYTTFEPNTLSIIDITDGAVRKIYAGPQLTSDLAVSADGRIAYVPYDYEWDVLEISLTDRRLHTRIAGSGASWWPDWAPSGTHFLFSTDRDGGFAIEDRSLQDGFSRRLAEAPAGYAAENPIWAPDGMRFVFFLSSPEGGKLILSNASGGRATALDSGVLLGRAAWSPDGQWVAYARMRAGLEELVKIRPGSGGEPVILAKRAEYYSNNEGYPTIQWSPTGEWILVPSDSGGLSLLSPDGQTTRKLTSRRFLTYGFSKDGIEVFGIERNSNPEGAEWQLYSVDAKSGGEKLLGPVDLPPVTQGFTGFSLHPDGKSFLTSVATRPFDIWMLEGFDQKRTWLDLLLRR